MFSLSRLFVRDPLPELIRAPKGRANKAQANGLGLKVHKNLPSQQARKGRNNDGWASAVRRP